MDKIVIVNDYANINSGYQYSGYVPEYSDLLSYLVEGRFLIEAHAYVPIDPRNPTARDQEVEQLWSDGWLVHAKMGAIAGESYKCDFDVEITMDLMRTAEIVRPDVVVLLSGDKDFIPVVLELRNRGIRVEVGAFKNSAAREMQLKASGFIDLDFYMEEFQQRRSEADNQNHQPLAEVFEQPSLDESSDETEFPRP